jgi:hypothetical protein
MPTNVDNSRLIKVGLLFTPVVVALKFDIPKRGAAQFHHSICGSLRNSSAHFRHTYKQKTDFIRLYPVWYSTVVYMNYL